MRIVRGERIVHVSWLIALFSVCFVGGVWASLFARTPLWILLVGGVVSMFGFVVRPWWGAVFVVASGILIGLGYGGWHQQLRDPWQAYIGKVVVLKGAIAEDPTIGKQGVAFQLRDVAINVPLSGQLWGRVETKQPIKRGDEIVVQGKVSAGFGTFPATMPRASLVSVSQESWSDPGREVRDWFTDGIRKGVPEPAASLGVGFLTGQKSTLPEHVSDAMQVAGLTHIVVASGYNLTILVRLSRRLFERISKYLAACVTMLFVASFVLVTGLSPSMSRAGLVSSLSLAAWYYGRSFHPFVLLPFAAAVTVLYKPEYAWGDLGWQLSFLAFAGVMIVAPLMHRYFFGEKEPGMLRQILGETIAAHSITLPVTVGAFGVVSNVAIIANLLIVPFVPLAMLLTFTAGVISLALPCLAILAGWPATMLLQAMLWVVDLCASLPWAKSELEVPGWVWPVYYAGLGFICVVLYCKTKLDLREAEIV